MLLTTGRLVLREFEESDWQAVFNYQRKPLYLRYNPWETRSEADVRHFVSMFMQWRQEEPRRKYQFAAILRENGRLIGNCGIRATGNKIWESEIGYEFDDTYWGQGYATEAARALLRFGFTDLRQHRIWAHCIAENTGSARVMQKIGMRFEGRLYESEWMKERWWDTLLYAILEREWRQQT